MSVPINLLNPDQRYWYAKLVLSAILADGQIDSAEVEFLKQVIGIVKDEKQRQRLMRHIQSKTPPKLQPPEGIPDQVLAAIFAELVLICIADVDFDETEEHFLRQVADLMEFT